MWGTLMNDSIMQILILCREISGKGFAHAFCNYCGHVDCLSVSVWVNDKSIGPDDDLNYLVDRKYSLMCLAADSTEALLLELIKDLKAVGNEH